MKTAGIMIDDWKLDTFTRVLEAAGYTFTKHPGLTAGTLLLKVKAQSLLDLKEVIEKAQKECRS